MFSKAINGITLTGEVADRLFSNITATGAIDYSFAATLRALLHKRLPQDRTVLLSVIPKQYYLDEIESASTSDNLRRFIPDGIRTSVPSRHSITIVHATQQGVGAKMMQIVRENAGVGKRHMSDHTRRDDLQVFYARKLNALFYTDDAGKNTVIFTDKLELKHFHALQMIDRKSVV